MFCCLSFSVVTPENQVCQHSHSITLPPPPGYLSSATADESGFGLPYCPWTLTISPGRQIRISIYKFSPTIMDNSLRRGACESYLSIKEDSRTSNITICRGDVRYREVFISQANTIQLHIPQAPTAAKVPRRFLIYYEGISY